MAYGTCSECGKTVAISRTSAPPERRRCRDCQRRNPRISRPRFVPQELTCPTCGVVFTQKRSQQKYCCIEHRPFRDGDPRSPGRVAASRRRRLRIAATFDGVTDAEIFERDRWMCWLCRKRIGKSFRYPHPRSASIDHVLPLSRGGDDTALNKRAAHLFCNMSRHDGRPGEQMPLPFGLEGGELVPRPRTPRPRKPKPCLTCGEPGFGICELHVEIFYCRYCKRSSPRSGGRQVCEAPECQKLLRYEFHDRKISEGRPHQRGLAAQAMRERGMSWDAIADLLGYPKAGYAAAAAARATGKRSDRRKLPYVRLPRVARAEAQA